MSYRRLDDIAIADVAFEAGGATLEEVFREAGHATLSAMVEDLSSIRKSESRHIRLEDSSMDMLLFQFLQEIVYYKDAENLLLIMDLPTITKQNEMFVLKADASGEEADAERHHPHADVKAVTLHLFSLRQTLEGWVCTVVLDV